MRAHLRGVTRASAFSLLCVAGVMSACDSDDNGGTTTTGDPAKTSYDVSVSGGGDPVKKEVPAAEASESNGGASIVDGQIHLFLVGATSTINVVLQTDDGHTAPGLFGITGAGPEPNFALLSAPLAGGAFESESGSVRLSTCPTKVGDKLVGKLEDVVVRSALDGGTRTLSGTFDVHVYAMIGTLACHVEPTQPGPDTTDTSVTPGSCAFEACDDGGSCCPYVQCISQCELNCALQNPACSGFTPDPVQCAACMHGCLDQCEVSSGCRTAYTALDACGSEHGCSGTGDEADEQCLREHCCDELGATF